MNDSSLTGHHNNGDGVEKECIPGADEESAVAVAVARY
jgi:hypothetical protein